MDPNGTVKVDVRSSSYLSLRGGSLSLSAVYCCMFGDWRLRGEDMHMPIAIALPDALQSGAQELVSRDKAVGWSAFNDAEFLGEMAIVLTAAVVLAAVIAYHPLTRAKVSSIEQLEQPKTFLMYAMVAAVIAQIVQVQPSMALVIFGIGGLLRFRTNVGEAKDTGRVILVTVVGLCCGLNLYVIAVLATGFGWLIIMSMETRVAGRLVVQGLDVKHMPKAMETYAATLHAAGCKVVGTEANVKKGMVSLVFKAPRRFTPDRIKQAMSAVQPELQGAVDWQMA